MRAILAFAALCAVSVFAATPTPLGRRAVVHLHLKGLLSDEAIEREFVARSTPGSDKFRQHLSVDELKTVVGASPVTIAKVSKFVSSLPGASDVSIHLTNDIVSLTVAAGTEAATAFGLAGRSFFGDDLPMYRRVAPSVPSTLAAAVQDVIVLGGAKAAHVRKTAAHFSEYAVIQATGKQSGVKPSSTAQNLKYSGMSITPQEISTRYKAPLTAASVPSGYSQGVGEFEASYFKQSDIEQFSQHFNLTVPVVAVVGPNTVSQDDIEGTLDVEYMTAISGT